MPIVVNMNSDTGAVDHRMAGFLGIPWNATEPPDALLLPVKPSYVRGAAYTLNSTYTRIAALGGRAGLNIGDDPAVIPGVTMTWQAWLDSVTTIINAQKAAGRTVDYEVWNEPDLTSFWTGTDAQWFETWRQTFLKIRELEPTRAILGPSLSNYSSGYDGSWGGSTAPTFMGAFLDYVKANTCVPDILTWHEMGAYGDVITHKADAVALLAARSIPLTRFAVNEFIPQAYMFLPDQFVGFIRALDSSGIEFAGRSSWNDPGMGGAYNGYNQTMDGTVTNESPKRPRSIWWVYKGYADITGRRVSVTQLNGTSAIAGKNSTLGTANVLIGNHGLGAFDVQFTNISTGAPYLIIAGKVRVKVQRIIRQTPNEYDAMPTIPTIIDADYTVSGDAITVSIPYDGDNRAFSVQLVGTASGAPTVNLATAVLGWDWTQGAGGVVSSFTIKPGSVGSTFTPVTGISGALRQYPLQSVIAASGLHSFRVVAVNVDGSAADSNELTGDVVVTVTRPAAPTSLRVVA